jgi:hypothetical protein
MANHRTDSAEVGDDGGGEQQATHRWDSPRNILWFKPTDKGRLRAGSIGIFFHRLGITGGRAKECFIRIGWE